MNNNEVKGINEVGTAASKSHNLDYSDKTTIRLGETPSEFVAHLDRSFKHMYLKEIKQVGDICPMSGFILLSCFIDAISCVYYGTKNTDDIPVKKRYTGLLNQYLSDKYMNNGVDSLMIYEKLRCNLVHNYSAHESILFTHDNNAGEHLTKKDDKIIFNFIDFYNDLSDVYTSLITDIQSNDVLYRRAKNYIQNNPILQLIQEHK